MDINIFVFTMLLDKLCN